VFRWKRRTRADALEAAAESERLPDPERGSVAVQAAARQRERQLLGQALPVRLA